jgi:D-glycero-D-manno-heptose 1,7-bisphosphate phosphatase
VNARAAVFLDRDGVLIEEIGSILRPEDIHVLDGVGPALAALHAAGYALVVVTNQTVVSRGLASEQEVDAMNSELQSRLDEAGAPALDGVYVCPHHPNATVERYRVDCSCRKPRPGLLLRAARELGLDLAASVMVGDRDSDIGAGMLAGCATVLVRSGAHEEPPIESTLAFPHPLIPDCVSDDLPAAVSWILDRR